MFAALILAADLAGSLAVSERTEVRGRMPGTAPASSSSDLETTLEARLGLASRHWRYAFTYAPRLTLWDMNTGARPTLLHSGSARVEWSGLHTRLSLDETASYGGVDFASFSLMPGPDGVPPPVDVIPPRQIIQFVSSATTLASQITTRRWTVDTSVGYQLGGGAGAGARQLLPFQRGPSGELKIDYAVSRRDRVATTLSVAEASFSSGPESILAELDEGWRRSLTRTIETRMAIGVSEVRARTSAITAPTFATYPVAEAVLEQRHVRSEGHVDVRFGARLGPVVNRLIGVVDERAQATLDASHAYRRFTTHAYASGSQSIPASGAYATTLVAGELGVAYGATNFVTFDVGVRGIWQRQDITQAVFLQGTVFAGVTFRAPPMRL